MTTEPTEPTEPIEPGPPVLRVVRGDATPEEVAALLAVVQAAGAATDQTGRTAPAREWGSPRRAVSTRATPLRAGRDGWRASAFPC